MEILVNCYKKNTMNVSANFNNPYNMTSNQLFAHSTDHTNSGTMELMVNDKYLDRSNSNPLVEDDVKPLDFTKAHLDSFEESFENNDQGMNYDINALALDLSHTEILEPPKYDEIDMEPLVWVPSTSEPAEANNVVNYTNKTDISPIIDPTEEELEIIRFLETQTNEIFSEPKMSSPLDLPTSAYRIINCSNCNVLFDLISFQSHECDHDEQHNFILPVKEAPLWPAEPDCIRLLKENQIRIRNFIQDEINYDVNNNNTVTNLNKSLNRFTAASESSNAEVNSSTLSTNKQDCPHECYLCEKKFVHASTFLRHMKHHTLESGIESTRKKITKKSSADQDIFLQNVNNLRIVIKCTLCGRIFFEPNSSLKHMSSHFSETNSVESEMGNAGDIPCDSFVDQALKYLIKKAQSAPYNDEKPPTYLKLIVLSCTLQCEFCDYIFSEVSYLLSHSVCHLLERRFECFACEIHVKTSKEICTHWQDECVFMKENLKVHKVNIPRYFVCNICENKFESLDLLHEHRYDSQHFFPRLSKRLGILQIPCEYCESICDNASECMSHYREKHCKINNEHKDVTCRTSSSTTQQYLCDLCGKCYVKNSALMQHLQRHQEQKNSKQDKTFPCKETGCTQNFTIRTDFNDHMRKCHGGEGPFQCLVCSKRFLTNSLFYQHRLTHQGERLHECKECGKRFKHPDSLKNHQRTHTGEKPFGCLHCTKTYKNRKNRNQHMSSKHPKLDANGREVPFQCLVCRKRFLTKSLLYKHSLAHRGKRLHECKECGKRLSRAHSLTIHLRTHTGEKPFGCLYCTKTYRQRFDCSLHMRSKHPELDANARLLLEKQTSKLKADKAVSVNKVSSSLRKRKSKTNPKKK